MYTRTTRIFVRSQQIRPFVRPIFMRTSEHVFWYRALAVLVHAYVATQRWQQGVT